jgi:hypothetical protein
VSFYKQIVNDLINKKQFNRIDLVFSLDHNKITYEFDLLKRELPETYKEKLKPILSDYEWINHLHDNLYQPNNQNDEKREFNEYSITNDNEYFIDHLSRCLKHIIYYLKGMLNPETGIQEMPQKFEKLKPFEKILIFHYLNERNKLFKYPLNSKSGKYFLSRLLDINPDSIKNPVSNISDYTTNKVTEKQAESLYKTLETVKSFFDNSELFEISKVIEPRINELRIKAGKD